MDNNKYKNTEMKNIPEGWKWKTISEVAENFTGLTYSPTQVCSYGTLVLRSSNIQNGQLSFEDNVFVDMEIPERAIAKEGDILVCVRNGSKNLIGKSAIITKKEAGMAFGAFMTVLRANNLIDSKYLLYAWRTGQVQKQVQESLGATINQITNADFKKFAIPLPPLPEQRRIAAILSDMDAHLAALDALIAKKQAIKKGTMQQLLTGEKRLAGFDNSFLKSTLNEILSIKKGIQLNGSELHNSGKYPMQNGGISFSGYTDFYNTEENTITISEGGESCGYVNFITQKFWCGGHCYKVMPTSKIINTYLYHLLKANENKIKKLRAGSGLPNIQVSSLLNFEIYFHSNLPEQRAISAILSDMDKEISALQAKRAKYEALKHGAMQRLINVECRM